MGWTIKTAMVKCPFCGARHGVKMYVSKQLSYVDKSLVDDDGKWRDDKRANARFRRNFAASEETGDSGGNNSADDSGNDSG